MTKTRNKVNVRELTDKYQANCERIGAIADACENEQRERTEAETAEYETLARENAVLQMRMQPRLPIMFWMFRRSLHNTILWTKMCLFIR